MRKKLVLFTAISALALGCLTGCGKGNNSTGDEGAKKVATDGSTSMEKMIGALGEAFMNENDGISFTYNPTGSSSGITAVLDKTCDIGLSSRHLKDEEKEKGLEETVVAIDGIAVIVNPSNNVDDLSIEQIADIYTGKITDWSELGGESGEIVVIGREAGSGTRDGFESITKTEGTCVLRQELTATGDVIAAVAGNENAIGYASLASVKDTVKAAKVDGVAPITKTVLDGTYKIQRPFVFVTMKGEKLTESAQTFMDFCLSENAKEIIEAAGVVPAN